MSTSTIPNPLVDPAELLRERVAAAGSQAAWARIHGLPASSVSAVLSGFRPPSRGVLNALGLKRLVHVSYRWQF